MLTLFAILVATATISCAHAPEKTLGASEPKLGTPVVPQPPPPKLSVDAPTTIDERAQHARALITEVAKERGLIETKPLVITFEDAVAFRASLNRVADEDTSDPEKERAKWVAFGFAKPEVDPHQVALAVLDEQVAAFYDTKEKRLHIPSAPPPAANSMAAAQTDMVLAHEIEHGLQDQHYPFPDLDKQPDDDRGLALKALYEGDATFVMLAVPEARFGKVDGAQLLLAARQLSDMPNMALLKMSGGNSDELAKAPKLVQNELMLPYLGGLRLVAELYVVGGYALVNQLFEHPPLSTEQVLHPQKYIEGEPPTAVEIPKVPEGARELTHGTLGELGIRALFSDCLTDEDSTQGALGWGGDSYLVAVRPDGQLILEWSTTWDTPADATRFSAALDRARTSGCFPTVRVSAHGNWGLDEGARVLARGANVALERGLGDDVQRATLEKLLKLPQKPQRDVPPIPNVELKK